MINTSNPSVSQEFDAVAFELEHSKDFQVLQNTYTNYEIDSVEECFGELFRIWNGRILLGSIYENSLGQWIANPYYQNRRCIKLDLDLSQEIDSPQKAIAYIKSTYEPKALSTL